MDPVSIVVAALAAGAAAGLKDTVAGAIKDAYSGLKRLISQRYADVSTSGLEKKPESKDQQSALKESLTDAGAGSDADLLAAAKALREAIKVHDPGAFATVGIELSNIEAASLDIGDVNVAPGAKGLDADDLKVSGAVKIGNINAGTQKPDHP
jgi:hypothetical protein